eukprot:gene2483-1550_t
MIRVNLGIVSQTAFLFDLVKGSDRRKKSTRPTFQQHVINLFMLHSLLQHSPEPPRLHSGKKHSSEEKKKKITKIHVKGRKNPKKGFTSNPKRVDQKNNDNCMNLRPNFHHHIDTARSSHSKQTSLMHFLLLLFVRLGNLDEDFLQRRGGDREPVDAQRRPVLHTRQ